MSGTRKTDMGIVRNVRVVRPSQFGEGSTGIGVFRTDDLKDQDYQVIAMFLFEFEDHSREPVFLIIRPEDGQILTRACSRFKVKEVEG